MKVNVKKLNQYYRSENNAFEMKALVAWAVESFTNISNGEIPNTHAITILKDLGLLSDM